MTAANQNNQRTSKWLIVVGSLWLVFSAGLFIRQFIKPASVTMEWTTETELETAGFNWYRSQSADGEFVQINKTLIPAKGDALSGASYTFTDSNVMAGETYFYVLEEVEYDATTNRYDNDMFTYTVPQTSWLVIALTAVSLLAGLWLIIMGIRENNQ